MSQVINSWRKGELKTIEEKNKRTVEEARHIELINIMSPCMEEEIHEEVMDESEYEGNDEDDTENEKLLNEEEIEETMKTYLESKKTKEEEDTICSEDE